MVNEHHAVVYALIPLVHSPKPIKISPNSTLTKPIP